MFGIPFLPTSMGKRPLLDTHELAATVARSLAIGKCDVVLVFGARLNWLLHFGEPPKWSKDVKFILVNVSKEEIELQKPHLGLLVLEKINLGIKDDPFCLGKSHLWVAAISSKVKDNVSKIEAQLAKEVVPFNFSTPMKIIRDAIAGLGSPIPILVSKRANTMDVGWSVLVQTEPRTRLDVRTWGTTGVGLGYCIMGTAFAAGLKRENSEKKKVAVAFLAIGVIFSPKTFGSKSDGLKSPTLSTYLKLAHLLCFSTTFGAALWATFIGGIIMFKNLPRHQFGNLQKQDVSSVLHDSGDMPCSISWVVWVFASVELFLCCRQVPARLFALCLCFQSYQSLRLHSHDHRDSPRRGPGAGRVGCPAECPSSSPTD
ncbi:hypothetical protein DVH24_015651 [Malus domestica]|uniref:Thiamine pyrophosphate enzyme central domain-containing protein n=1 Tax=Malus domestica TaxID=3750 RepID=A0A498HJ63_MALDO|nr:hypothetical protein DVH24_015651 [Malus domestica]